VCLLAEVLTGEHDVRVHDAGFSGPEQLARVVEEHEPDFVGLGIRNVDDMVMKASEYYVDAIAAEVVDPIRAATGAPLILGGAGFSILPSALLERLGGDYGIVGEGERALPALLAALQGDRRAEEVPGVLVRGGDTQRPAVPVTPEHIPFADIDSWIDYAPYRQRGSYPIQTSRGCSRRCIYCTYPLLEGRTTRLRSPASVVSELEAARARLGGVTFELVDSNFNVSAEHAEAICREILRRGLEVRLRSMGINPAGVNTELVALMQQAGFAQIDCTPDSASETMLEGLGKGFSRCQLERVARALSGLEMPTMWFFLFGGPGENERTVAETLEFIDEKVAPEDMVYAAVGLRIYPGTELHRRAVEEGIVDRGDSLLRPRFYVSPTLGSERLHELVTEACAIRPNCVPAWESTPSPEMVRRAMALREELHLREPMFRTFIRIRRERMAG
jgi:radical SAM superfamily enzyme YgiQ (UPF0313 family)